MRPIAQLQREVLRLLGLVSAGADGFDADDAALQVALVNSRFAVMWEPYVATVVDAAIVDRVNELDLSRREQGICHSVAMQLHRFCAQAWTIIS